MSFRQRFAAVTVCVAAVASGFAQAPPPPLGPVVPKPAPTVGDYETLLGALIEANSDDRLWNGTDAGRRTELLDRIRQLSKDITVQMKPVSPVVPRPDPPPATPDNPKPKPTNPSKQEWDVALKELHEVLQQGSGDLTMPPATAQQMQSLIEQLAKGKPQ